MASTVLQVQNLNIESVISNSFEIEHFDEKHTKNKKGVPRYRLLKGLVVGYDTFKGFNLHHKQIKDMNKSRLRCVQAKQSNHFKYAALLSSSILSCPRRDREIQRTDKCLS